MSHESFDDKALTWDADPQKVERAKILAQHLADFSKGKNLKKALEFGCGTGLVSFFLKDSFGEITLADTSMGMIEVLKNKIEAAKAPHFQPVLIDENTQFESNGFDVTYSLLTLHHITHLEQVFEKFYNLLRPGGYLCIADLVKEDGDFHNAEDSKHVHHGFDKEPLMQKLLSKGFKSVDYKIFHEIEKITEQGVVKKYPLFLLIVQK